jgi:glucose-1-phosphate cytidylyltransferase
MKVVLFCGGLGTRLREYSDTIPKPMVEVGPRPILWHVMKFYAHYGHKDFVLCLGYKGEVIKSYFLNYNEAISNDFVLSGSAANMKLLSSDIHDWTITFADTGLHSNIGERLKAVERYVKGEEMFLANYSDGLSDIPLESVIRDFRSKKKVAAFISVKPSQSFDMVQTNEDGSVRALEHVSKSGIWINGGYFIFRKEIFDYMKPGEELVYEPFRRLIAERQLLSYRHEGFFMCMDTFKEKKMIDDMVARGETPWQVWRNEGGA